MRSINHMIKKNVIKRSFKNKKGMTLLEVLMSMILLLIIVGLSVPNYINLNKQNNVVIFTEQLKQLTTALRMVSEVPNENYKHYPNPLWIDYTKVNTDIQSGEMVNKKGIPYIPNLDLTDKGYYFHIDLTPDTSKQYNVFSTVERYNVSGAGNETIASDQTIYLPYSLATALKEKYGDKAKLKVYPIDLETLTRYSSVRVDLKFPTQTVTGTNARGYQDRTVTNLKLLDLFPGSRIAAGTTSPTGTVIPTTLADVTKDENAKLMKSGYFFLLDNGDEKTIIYSGTDAKYKGKTIHFVNF